MSSAPYRSTPVFDEMTLPQALRRDHSTKAGVWGVIRILEGQLRLFFADGRELRLDPSHPGRIKPEEVHWVIPVGKMRMQVDFYDREPALTRN